jgi:hypothetical protein
MELRVYISRLKDEEFDYDIENPNGDSQYAPEPISLWYRLDDIFKIIVRKVIDHKENTKQTDWGTFVLKLTNANLIQFLSNYVSSYEKNNEKYYQKIKIDNPDENISKKLYEEFKEKHRIIFSDFEETNALLEFAKKLPDGEYLLVGQELF